MKLTNLFLLLAVSISARADIGDISPEVIRLFPEHAGQIFSDQNNDAVSLQREILLFKGINPLGRATWNAWFEFKNESKKDVTSTVAFPVEINTGFAIDANGNIAWAGSDERERSADTLKGSTGFSIEKDGLAAFFEKDILKTRKNPEQFKYRKKMSYAEYEKAAFPFSTSYSVSSNGKKHELQTVLIEASIIPRANEYQLSVRIIFTHSLHFKSGAATNVDCIITQDATVFSSTTHYDNHGLIIDENRKALQSDYVIGTGGTWKNSIDEMHLLVPRKFSIDPLTRSRFSRTGEYNGYDIYTARNYKPGLNERISISHSFSKFRRRETMEYYIESERKNREMSGGNRENGMAQDHLPIDIPYTSTKEYSEMRQSILSNTYEQPLKDKRVRFIASSSDAKMEMTSFSEGGKYTATSSPESALTGFSHSGWVTAGPGKNEWIDFELTENAVGLRLSAEHRRVISSPGPDNFATRLSEHLSAMYRIEFENNPEVLDIENYRFNSITTVALSRDKGDQISSISLHSNEVRPGEHLYPLHLQKGRYRLTIKDAEDNPDLHAYLSGITFFFCDSRVFDFIQSKAGDELDSYIDPEDEAM